VRRLRSHRDGRKGREICSWHRGGESSAPEEIEPAAAPNLVDSHGSTTAIRPLHRPQLSDVGAGGQVLLLACVGVRPGRVAFRPILLRHATRFVGLGFLVPGVVLPDLLMAFAHTAAYGDLIAALLALAA